MKGGWFIGSFEPTSFKTSDCEVCYKIHKAGEIWDKHYHAIAIEINYLIKGTMYINETLLQSGEIFILYPNEVAEPMFITDCELIIVKIPSIIGDKYIV